MLNQWLSQHDVATSPAAAPLCMQRLMLSMQSAGRVVSDEFRMTGCEWICVYIAHCVYMLSTVLWWLMSCGLEGCVRWVSCVPWCAEKQQQLVTGADGLP